jgi:hypothetical protein
VNGPAAPTLDLSQVERFARHIALPEIGVTGQARLCQARALVVADGAEGHRGASAARDYLVAAGLPQVPVMVPLATVEGWLAALEGASIALRFGFDDDVFLTATIRLGIPALVARARAGGVDLLSFRRHGPCPHRELASATRPAAVGDLDQGAAAVLAGTLAASEALLVLAAPASPPRARLLRLPLDGGAPVQAELPWAPECFLCGGRDQTASFT